MSNTNETMVMTIDDALNGYRLDKAISVLLDPVTRSQCAQWIDQGYVLLNGKTSKASTKVKTNDLIMVEPPQIDDATIEPQNIPLSVLYEDNDLIVINKPKGMVVHPAVGHTKDTLVNALLYHCHDLSGINGIKRPGIVHRLDKDTSGVLVACKNDMAHQAIATQFANHTTEKIYIALVDGIINEQAGSIDAPIGKDSTNRLRQGINENGKDALTRFVVLHRFEKHTLVAIRILTGRTHQIRVHFNFIHHPVSNDPLYGKTTLDEVEGQLLHAYQLSLVLPSDQKNHTFVAPLPDYFTKAMTAYGYTSDILNHMDELIQSNLNRLK